MARRMRVEGVEGVEGRGGEGERWWRERETMAIGNCEYASTAYNRGQEVQSRTRAHACRAAVEETTNNNSSGPATQR